MDYSHNNTSLNTLNAGSKKRVATHFQTEDA